MDIEQLTGARRDVGQGHQPAPRAAAGQPALPQAPERPAGAADRHRRRADLATSSPTARSTSPTRRTRSPSPTPSASSTTPAGSARRRRSSGSARTRAWPASSTRWPGGSTAGWSPRSSTTSAPPSSAPTSARAAPGGARRQLRRLVRRPRVLGRRLRRGRLDRWSRTRRRRCRGRTSMHPGRSAAAQLEVPSRSAISSVAARMRSASEPNAWASAPWALMAPDEDGGRFPASDPDEQLDQVAQRGPLVRPDSPSGANDRRWNGTAGERCWGRPSVRAARPDQRARCPRRRWPPPSRRDRWLAGTARSPGPVRAWTTPRPGRTRRGRASRGCPAAGPRGTAPRRRPGPRYTFRQRGNNARAATAARHGPGARRGRVLESMQLTLDLALEQARGHLRRRQLHPTEQFVEEIGGDHAGSDWRREAGVAILRRFRRPVAFLIAGRMVLAPQ